MKKKNRKNSKKFDEDDIRERLMSGQQVPDIIKEMFEESLNIKPEDEEQDAEEIENNLTVSCHVRPDLSLENVPLEYKKKFFKECKVAGISHYLSADHRIWDELEEGTNVILKREPNNKYDRNAIAVVWSEAYDGELDEYNVVLGYIPSSDNLELSVLMDAGFNDKLIAEISTFKRTGPIDQRIRITIYLESNVPEFVRPDLYRGHSLNEEEFNKMSTELNDSGVICIKLEAFPAEEFIFPIKNEKIILIYQCNDKLILYLTNVLALDDDCKFFNESWSDPHEDYERYFVLSVIAGPFIIEHFERIFNNEIDFKRLDGINYLSVELDTIFRGIFDRNFADTNISNLNFGTSIWDQQN